MIYLRAWMQPRVWAAIHVILQVVSVWATLRLSVTYSRKLAGGGCDSPR
ncbi:Uncharacterised protein [Enterobacter ludwigii]|nr:Uncharacterised protein [Enterobacter ludwigii]